MSMFTASVACASDITPASPSAQAGPAPVRPPESLHDQTAGESGDHPPAFVPESPAVIDAVAALRSACAQRGPVRTDPQGKHLFRTPVEDARICSIVEDPDADYLRLLLGLGAIAMVVLSVGTVLVTVASWFVRGRLSRSSRPMAISDVA